MIKIEGYLTRKGYGKLEPLSIKRDWMEDRKHSYQCYPIALANNLGWTISFPEDISFIFNGNQEDHPENITILSGHKYVFLNRLANTLSFNTGIMFKTPENISLLSFPVPNMTHDGYEPISNILSTSFLKGDLQPAWRILKANEVITIKAGTPIIAILPIDLAELQDSEITLTDKTDPSYLDEISNEAEYTKALEDNHRDGIFTGYYRKGVNHRKEVIGKHQVKIINLHVNDIIE